MWAGLASSWIMLASFLVILQKRGRVSEIYRAIWGLSLAHRGKRAG
jgi:hypothetical protein